MQLLLPLILATSVSAQWGDFLKSALKGGSSEQKPLVSETVGKATTDITSENWLRSINGTEEKAEEWLLYFTAVPPEKNNTGFKRNITFWDGVYDQVVYTISTAKPTPEVNFGKVNCTAPVSTELCNTFWLTSNYKIPVFYHTITHPSNGSISIRKIPFGRNATDEEQPARISKFVLAKEYEHWEPWNNVFNPMDGALRAITPYLGLAIGYWEQMPQWAFMLVVSLMGRTASSRMGGRRTNPGVAAGR